MKRFARRVMIVLSAGALLAAAACVTVNIYFPAAEVEKTAENIVKDVYGKKAPDADAQPEGESLENSDSSSLEVFLAWFAPANAWAQQAISVSNAAIRGLKAQIANNHKQLAPFYDQGAIGITNDGMVAVRNTDGLPAPKVAQLKRLVAADNQARSQLYGEVARALNIDPGQVGKVKGIFAQQWQSQAQPGWWIQDGSGNWQKK